MNERHADDEQRDRRVDDERINEIQRTCHVVQDSQTRLIEQYHSLNTRVSVVEERIVSREKETNSKLEVLGEKMTRIELLVTDNVGRVERKFDDHTNQEAEDRRRLISNQRQVSIWLAGLVFTAGISILVFVLERIFPSVN